MSNYHLRKPHLKSYLQISNKVNSKVANNKLSKLCSIDSISKIEKLNNYLQALEVVRHYELFTPKKKIRTNI